MRILAMMAGPPRGALPLGWEHSYLPVCISGALRLWLPGRLLHRTRRYPWGSRLSDQRARVGATQLGTKTAYEVGE